jgi:hypothetical protein
MNWNWNWTSFWYGCAAGAWFMLVLYEVLHYHGI